MEKDLISVIVPVYNVKPYLNTCIESIRNQTYDNMEIILIDDGSTDGSEKICDDQAALDNRIRVFHQRNCGVSPSRNKGILEMKGNYFTFIDSDDFWDEDYLLFLYNLLLKYNAQISVCGTRHLGFPNIKDKEISEFEDVPIVLTGCEAAKEVLLAKKGLGGSACRALFAKTDNYKEIFFPLVRFYEDLEFMLKSVINANKVVVSNVKKYNYRYRIEGSSRVPVDERIQNLHVVISNIENENQEQEYELQPYIDQRFIKNAITDLRNSIITDEMFTEIRNEILKRKAIYGLLNSSNYLFYYVLKIGKKPFHFCSWLYDNIWTRKV